MNPDRQSPEGIVANKQCCRVSYVLMKSLHRCWSFIFVAVMVALLGMNGGTCGQTGTNSEPPAKERDSGSPFLNRPDYPEHVGVALEEVLSAHRFLIPWIAIRGSNSSIWFVAERFESDRRFDRIRIQVRPENKVTATITPFFRGPSDWAILGRLFADPSPEAKSIAAEISKKLDDHDRRATQ